VTITEAEVYTGPFTFSGGLTAAENEVDLGFVCVICPPGERSIPLTGRGFARLELSTDIFPEHGLIHDFRSLTYEFQLVPEPSAMWLVLCGGAVIAVGHRLRRASRNRL
jgi:hypothetical protein